MLGTDVGGVDRAPFAGAIGVLRDVGARIEHRLDRFLGAEIARWSEVDPVLAEPLSALRRLCLAGGKRIRPAFCHLAFVGAGGARGSAAELDVGCAFELLHTAALVHDDIMDAAPTRRGEDSVHRAFAKLHRTWGVRSDADAFGESAAILVGDLAFVYADVLMVDAPRAVVEVYNEARLEVSVGQYLDVRAAAHGSADAATASRICRYKSGKYTVERPLHLGAALAGRLDDLAAPLTRFAEPLGEAFQLRDDVLGVLGDAGLLGKSTLADLHQGSPNRVVLAARARARGDALRLLDERLGRADLAPDEIDVIRQLLVDVGALDECEDRIRELTAEALVALDAVPLHDHARRELAELAQYASYRPT